MLYLEDDFLESGLIKFLKIDIIFEAADDPQDLYWLSQIKKDLLDRNILNEEEANIGAARLALDLIEKNYFKLSIWNSKKQRFDELNMTEEELIELISNYGKPDVFPFDYCLIATEKSIEWAVRYQKLIDEIE